MSFIKGATDSISRAMDITLQKSSFDLLRKIVKRTPVDTGRLRGNWQLKVNRAPRGEVGVVNDKSGTNAIKLGQSESEKAKAGDVVHIVNNLPYAEAIEYGHSQSQAPMGMMRITVAEFQAIVDLNFSKAKKK